MRTGGRREGGDGRGRWAQCSYRTVAAAGMGRHTIVIDVGRATWGGRSRRGRRRRTSLDQRHTYTQNEHR